MRFKQYIIQEKLESFDIQIQIDSTFQTHFRTDTMEFYFNANRFGGPNHRMFNIMFYKYEGPMKHVTKGTGKTSAKESIQVFEGVKKSLEMFIKKYNPERFEFESEDKEHQKLYKSLAPILARKAGYKLEAKKNSWIFRK